MDLWLWSAVNDEGSPWVNLDCSSSMAVGVWTQNRPWYGNQAYRHNRRKALTISGMIKKCQYPVAEGEGKEDESFSFARWKRSIAQQSAYSWHYSTEHLKVLKMIHFICFYNSKERHRWCSVGGRLVSHALSPGIDSQHHIHWVWS